MPVSAAWRKQRQTRRDRVTVEIGIFCLDHRAHAMNMEEADGTHGRTTDDPRDGAAFR
jgi:hypothetical protein